MTPHGVELAALVVGIPAALLLGVICCAAHDLRKHLR